MYTLKMRCGMHNILVLQNQKAYKLQALYSFLHKSKLKARIMVPSMFYTKWKQHEQPRNGMHFYCVKHLEMSINEIIISSFVLNFNDMTRFTNRLVNIAEYLGKHG